MDNQIVDVVLGLLLVYLVLALLVSQLQETFFGTWGRSRQRTLHDMLNEALGSDGDVKARLLANPAIAALYQGSRAKVGAVTTGPSAIPSDLFARALLAALNGENGDHPSVRFASPRTFIDKRGTDGTTIWTALRTLLAGAEGNWPRFERAIATWWDQIGERANGWYQRKAQRRVFWLALAVAALFNAGTFQLVERLSGDPLARQAFSSLARQVAANISPGTVAEVSGAMAPASPTSRPADAADRAEQALQRAHVRLAEQFFGRDRSLANFEPKRLRFDPDASGARSEIEACAKASLRKGTPPAKDTANGALGRSTGPWWLSDAQTWLQLLPPLRRSIMEARLPEALDPAKATRAKVFEDAYLCIGNLVGWVTTAASASSDAAAAGGLQSASADLGLAADALREILENRRSGVVVRELFRTDPEAFGECAGMPGMSRERLAACVASAANGATSLPLGWTGRNLREAFCRVEVLPVSSEQGSDCLRNGAVFEGNAALGIQRMVLRSNGWTDAAWLALGYVVTAFFVSLGAPFWFDVLGRIVKLRAAGARPEKMAEKAPAGPADAEPAGSPVRGDAAQEPFSDARNEFERILTAADKVTLQQLIGVPATGRLDNATRSALVAKARDLHLELPEVDQLSMLAFTRITGGLPAALEELHRGHSAQPAAAPPLDELAGRLATALALPASRSTDDQRALAVLYTYKAQRSARKAGQTLIELAVCRAASSGELAGADAVAAATRETLIEALASVDGDDGLPAFPRESAPWLDWALGELGQSQRDALRRADSNPRVLAYLEAGGMSGEFGDETDWCAGFVCWALSRYSGESGASLPSTQPDAEPLRAQSWLGWGVERPPGQAQPGDVAVLHPGGTTTARHVAFVLEQRDSRLWVIGGNQSQAQGLKRGVTVTSFPIDRVVAVRRPG